MRVWPIRGGKHQSAGIGIRGGAFTVILLLCTVCNVGGATITSPASLSPGATLIDFESFSSGELLPNPFTIGDLTFTSLSGSGPSILDISASGWPANGTEVVSKALFPGGEPEAAISITFRIPVSEFLLAWGDPNDSGNVLQAYNAQGVLLETAAVEIGPVGGVHAAWIGFQRSSADIARVIVQPDQSRPSGDDYVIDNIYYTVLQPVPEPSTIFLLASTSCALSVSRQTWRKRRHRRDQSFVHAQAGGEE